MFWLIVGEKLDMYSTYYKHAWADSIGQVALTSFCTFIV